MVAWSVVFVILAVAVVTAQADHLLDMAPNSVDDMYDGCQEEMRAKVEKDFQKNEKTKNQIFSDAWAIGEKYYKDNPGPSSLSRDEIVAVHAYTLKDLNLYRDLNNAVRTQRSEYRDKFGFHTLHYYLTTAIQKLKPGSCVTTYRRVSSSFKEVVVGKEFRFGSFTSSSTDDYPDEAFGTKSCFQIKTCFGAGISKYSKFKEEREVLIPPYEVFKVTKIENKSVNKELPCELVYIVESTEERCSNLNCEFIRTEKEPNKFQCP